MKFGIIGYGRMGKVYAEVLNESNIEIAFIVDLKKPEDDVKNFFTDYKTAMEKIPVDGIIVSTTSPSHHEIIKYAIEKKIKYIACEKTFTTSVKHADELIKLLKSSNTRLTVNYSRRFSERYIKLKKDLYEKNILGKPRSIVITSGAGGLSALGTHFFDFCSFILDGKVKSVHAIPIDKKLPNPRGSEFEDPGGYVILNFDNETRAFIDLGDDLGIQFMIEIVCEFGRVLIDELNETITIRARSEDDRTKPRHLYVLPNPVIRNERFKKETKQEWIKKMIENLVSDSELIVTAEIAKEKVEIYSAIRHSFDSKQTIHLPLTNDYYERVFMVT